MTSTLLGGSVSKLGESAVRVEDLHVTFTRDGQQVQALRGVDLEVAPGELLGLVGESGSGKSVLGSAVLGLLPMTPQPATSGRVMVKGTDMLSGPERDRRSVRRHHLGAVFQDPMTSLNPTQRVGFQLIEAAGSVEESVRLLEAAGIPRAKERMSSYPHELSGGLRQRVMIAMALAGEPSLVVADEPTTALDVTIQAQILQLFREVCDNLQVSIILVTHDLGVASEIADRVAVMYAGRIVEIGSTDAILSSPSHPYTRGLLRSRLSMTAPRLMSLRSLPGEPPDPSALPSGCAFAPRCAHAASECGSEVPTLTRAAGHLGWTACVLDGSLAGRDVPAHTGTSSPPTLSSTNVVLEFADVTKVFRSGRGRHRQEHRAVDGVDLTVHRGEAVAVVGESGSGKSTLLRIAAGLIGVDEGHVQNVGERGVQMVFQDAGASMTPWLTVGAHLQERLRGQRIASAERRSRIDATMELVGLNPRMAACRPAELSGGQRQRAAIARAVVVPPDLLLCDEPTSALDVSVAAVVLNMLRDIRQELHIAMLFVTHDLAAARFVGDRIIAMKDGQIVEEGQVDELVERPKHPYTRSLLAAIPGARVAAITESLLAPKAL
jgi:peptide/nickel transport system ATP-binding protein